MNNESTRDKLIIFLITSIAVQEGKFADGRITGDRDYVLGLTAAIVQALAGHKVGNSSTAETEKPLNIPDELLESIRAKINSLS
jgi:hypothetical protein